ncbi:hypothetical protein [Streptomyces sp. NPDC055287]
MPGARCAVERAWPGRCAGKAHGFAQPARPDAFTSPGPAQPDAPPGRGREPLLGGSSKDRVRAAARALRRLRPTPPPPPDAPRRVASVGRAAGRSSAAASVIPARPAFEDPAEPCPAA